jgi:hypothetical protein
VTQQIFVPHAVFRVPQAPAACNVLDLLRKIPANAVPAILRACRRGRGLARMRETSSIKKLILF